MKLTVEELYNLASGIGELSKKELPTKTAFKIGRNNRKISDEIKTADELRQKLVDKYKDDNGEGIRKDAQTEFKREFDELLAQEVEISLASISLNEIGDTATGLMLANLERIIVTGEDGENDGK